MGCQNMEIQNICHTPYWIFTFNWLQGTHRIPYIVNKTVLPAAKLIVNRWDKSKMKIKCYILAMHGFMLFCSHFKYTMNMKFG